MGYKSKYYDPVKAHEYYMKHRKLKGRKKLSKAERARRSTKNLNENGLAAFDEVKEQINKEYKAFIAPLTKEMNAKIKALKKGIKSMSEEQKAKLAEQISAIRDSYKELKSAIKEQYNEKAYKELDEIKKDKSLLK